MIAKVIHTSNSASIGILTTSAHLIPQWISDIKQYTHLHILEDVGDYKSGNAIVITTRAKLGKTIQRIPSVAIVVVTEANAYYNNAMYSEAWYDNNVELSMAVSTEPSNITYKPGNFYEWSALQFGRVMMQHYTSTFNEPPNNTCIIRTLDATDEEQKWSNRFNTVITTQHNATRHMVCSHRMLTSIVQGQLVDAESSLDSFETELNTDPYNRTKSVPNYRNYIENKEGFPGSTIFVTPECPICFEMYDDEETRGEKVLECGHAICLLCVIRLVEVAHRTFVKCPMCNKEYQKPLVLYGREGNNVKTVVTPSIPHLFTKANGLRELLVENRDMNGPLVVYIEANPVFYQRIIEDSGRSCISIASCSRKQGALIQEFRDGKWDVLLLMKNVKVRQLPNIKQVWIIHPPSNHRTQGELENMGNDITVTTLIYKGMIDDFLTKSYGRLFTSKQKLFYTLFKYFVSSETMYKEIADLVGVFHMAYPTSYITAKTHYELLMKTPSTEYSKKLREKDTSDAVEFNGLTKSRLDTELHLRDIIHHVKKAIPQEEIIVTQRQKIKELERQLKDHRRSLGVRVCVFDMHIYNCLYVYMFVGLNRKLCS
jgi:hypothetical protein